MSQESIPLSGVHHIGVVVKDVEAVVDFYEKHYGCVFQTPPDTGTERTRIIRHKGAMYRGKQIDYAVKVAHTKLGPIILEFVQPLEGKDLRGEFLENHGEGIQHIGVRVDDLKAELAKLEKLGFKILLQPESGWFITWAYLDTDKKGGITYEFTQRRRPP